jgi:hypothetical protein
MELIDSYPGLLDRLTSGEEEDVIHVGELVSFLFRKFVMLTVYSSVKEPLVREATIPRPLNLPSSNGLCLEDRQSSHLFPGILSRTADSIMKLPVRYFAPQALTGQTWSKLLR